MKSTTKLLLALLTLTFCYAFTTTKNDGLNATYGVSDGDPSQIELRLNEDYTFSYQDFSIPSQQIKVEGTYQMKNNKIQLIPKNEQVEFHHTWKILDDGAVAKSRKGLAFYTLKIK